MIGSGEYPKRVYGTNPEDGKKKKKKKNERAIKVGDALKGQRILIFVFSAASIISNPHIPSLSPFFSRLHAQRGARTQDLEIKSPVLYRLR